jgi:Tfp pilus assembly protein PilO
LALLAGINKKELGYLLGGLVASSALAWFLLYAPAIVELKRLKAEVAARQETAAESMRQWGEMRRSKGKETEQWEASVRKWDERVPTAQRTDELMSEIGEQAVRHGLTGFRLTVPAEGGAESGMGSAMAAGDATRDNVVRPSELRYEIVFRSSYRDLSAFLDELPHLRRLVALRTLQVRDDDGVMEAKLAITAYYRGRP